MSSSISLPFRRGDLVVVMGAGTSGAAAARLVLHLGAKARLLELKEENVTPETRAWCEQAGVEILTGAHSPEQFAGAALTVISPGIPVERVRELLARAGNIPLMGEMELGLTQVREPILAVTGTNGKTTTVSLCAAMLEAAGKKVFLGGNIGTPLSEYVLRKERADVLVLELSSFQLQGCASLHPKVAVLLNLTENHLDHHKDMAEYMDAKFSLFALQGPDDVAVLPGELTEEYTRRGMKGALRVFAASGRFPRTRLVGRHNAANIEAAYLACKEFGVSEADAARAVAAFAPLPHRLELVAEVAGVRYVNDSKCTTIEALRAALDSFDAPVLLLAGGKYKGGDLASLRSLLTERVRAVALFGGSRETFEKAWHGAVPLTWDATLDLAVKRLSGQALSGEVVLLAPGTSSYDQYVNYLARGEHFRALAEALRGGAQ